MSRTAYAAANLLMTAVVDDLCTVRRLLGEQMPVIGVPVVARSALEIGHKVWCLMEPGIGGRRRTCRELVLGLTGSRRAKQVAQGLQTDPGASEALGQEQHVVKRITELGLPWPPISGLRARRWAFSVSQFEEAVQGVLRTGPQLLVVKSAHVLT